MVKKNTNGLFIFRRDLRIADNMALHHACSQCDNVYTCFIFTPEQVGRSNPYKSDNAIQFMIESLTELSSDIHAHGGELMVFHGNNKRVIADTIDALKIDVVFFNRDYTPYAILRDEEISQLCAGRDIKCSMFQDYYLYEPGTVVTKTGTIYKKFTPFYDEVIKLPIDMHVTIHTSAFKKCSSAIKQQKELIDMKRILVTENTELMVNGGRIHGLEQLKHSVRTQAHYADTRNLFAVNTSQLSAYLKFGCISVREVYRQFVHSFGIKSEIMRQLIWREFYAHVLFGYPNHKSSLKSSKWSNNMRHFDVWCTGNTGFPIVDACMRQLNATGWMHNRGRLVVSCFLVKTLIIDWKWGEQYFANKLVDYDVASNNGNWQWISGSGVDSMPYFRTFNPWTQTEKYDPNTEFIKKWVPELKDVDTKIIHKWDVYSKDKNIKIGYPAPVVDFSTQHHKMLDRYS